MTSPRDAGYVPRLILAFSVLLACGTFSDAAIHVPPPAKIASEIAQADSLAKPIAELEAAVICFRKQDFEGCWKLLSVASAKHKELPPPRLMLAGFFIVHDQLPPAHMSLEQAAVEHGDYPGVYISFGKLALAETRLTDAKLQFVHAATLVDTGSWPDNLKKGFQVQILEGLASVSSARGSWADAEKHLNAWLELAPASSVARSRLARVLFAMQRPDEAYQQFQLATDKDPASELPSVAMGWLCGQSGDPQQANDWMQRALQESPDDARSHLGMAAWLMQQGKFEQGLAEARIALRLAPDSYEARLLCAFLAWSQADYVAAEEILQTLHQENPDDLTVSCQLVLALADQADSAKHELAMRLSQANLEAYPSSSDVRASTGWVYFRTGQFDNAEELLRQALADEAGQPQTVYYLACVLAAQGRTAEAKPLLEKVISVSETFVLRPSAKALLQQITEGPLQPVAVREPAVDGDASP